MKVWEVKSMEMVKGKRSNDSSRSWTRRAEHKHRVEAGFYPELRMWVQHTIMDAEKRGNFRKKDQLLDLLREL
jgi:hypothetical protein